MDKTFEKALTEASKLQGGNWCFNPDLDGVETVSDILYKVLCEVDLIKEGEIDLPTRSLTAYKKKLVNFIVKYRDYCDNESEKKLYTKFVAM